MDGVFGKRNVQISAIKTWTQHRQVYNLTVDTTHTYYVAAGDANVLAHNCGDRYVLAKPNAPTNVLEPGEAWHPSKGIPVLGRQGDTEIVDDWPGYTYLNIDNWSLAKNDAYIQTIID